MSADLEGSGGRLFPSVCFETRERIIMIAPVIFLVVLLTIPAGMVLIC